MDGAEVDHQTSAMVPEEAVTFIPPESRENAPSSPTPTPGAELSFINGLAIVIGLQIGSGIFSAPAQVSAHVLSPGVGVLIWLCSGLLVWTGAATFIELGLAIPQNGGVQEYLQHCYGDFPAFVFTWSWVWVSKPAAMAIISMVFADYSCNLASASPTSVWVTKPVAVLGLAFVTLINCLGTKTGPQVANGFLILKISLVASIALTGIALLVFGNAPAASEPNFGWFQPQPMKGMDGKGSWFWMGEAVTAAFGALFCYGGWETVSSLTWPVMRSLMPSSMLTLVHLDWLCGRRNERPSTQFAEGNQNVHDDRSDWLCPSERGFVCRSPNARYARTACCGVGKSKASPPSAIGILIIIIQEFGSSTFGATGARLYSILIATSAIGTLNVNVFATGRLCVAASKRRYFPSILSNMHYDHRTQESDYYRARLRRMPSLILAAVLMFAETTANLRLVEEVPM